MKLRKLSRLAAAAAASTMAVATVGVLLTTAPAFAANGTVLYPTGSSTTSDGQIVTVSAAAGTFIAGAHVQMEECQGTTGTPPTSNITCSGSTLNASGVVAADGSVSVNFHAWVLGVAGFQFGASPLHLDASGTHPGVIYIGLNQNDFTQTHVFADLVIGDFGNAKPLPQSAGPATPGGAAVTLNAATGASGLDSAGNAETSTFSVTTPATQGTAACTAAGACTYSANASAVGATDTFVVTQSVTPTVGTWVGANPVTGTATETITLLHGNNPTVAPAPNPLALSSSAAGTTGTFTPNAAGTDSGGHAETITGVTSTNGTFGTVSCLATSPFTCTYTYTGGAPAGGGTDTVTVTATAVVASTTAPTFTGTAPETISIPPQFTPNCDAGPGSTTPACPLNQIVNIPITAGDLTMAQSSGLPTDTLGATLTSTGACTGPALTLNGQAQYACGTMAPITVINARGTDAGWDLTGQITDFIDSGLATNTALTPVGATPLGTLNNSCDTVASYNNHCIPGGNAGWLPAAAVAQNILPGDVAEVLPGLNIFAPGFVPPVNATGTLAGNCGTFTAPAHSGTYYPTAGYSTNTCQVQPTGNVYPNYPVGPGGYHTSAQTLCSSSEPTANLPVNGSQAMPAGHAGGTFVCGALLVVGVPASAARPSTPGINGQTGYEAFLTLTLA